MTSHELAGRTALVSGASRGIGLAAAVALADAGANVVVTSRKQESADAAAAQIGPRALGVAAHAVDEDAAQRCVELTLERFGSIDILVNNAGTNPAAGPLITQDHARFAKTVDVNLWAPLLWTKLAVQAWMGERGGSVINTASIGGMVHEANIGVYNTTKSALIYLTEQLSLELSPRIRVNGVAPGVVRTKLAEALWREHEPQVAAATPLGVAAHAVDEDAAQRCVELTLERFGSIDILVNNAGTNPAAGPLITQDHARFAKTVDVNLWAPLLWTKLAVQAWMGERGGSVINTASIGGMVHEANIGVYNTTKSALIYLTEQLSLELSPRIRVNGVAPGVVRTKLAEALWREHEPQVAAATPLGRIGEPEDIASAIVFLASDASSWMTGEVMVIDGGQRLGDASQYR